MRWIIPYICVLLLSEVALAQAQVTPPSAVQNKEYADHMPPAGIATTDVNALGVADPLQIVQWDGLGSAADGSDETPPVGPWDPDEIDALCGLQDAYFDEVVNNQVPITISLATENFLHYLTPGGQAGVWATASQINAINPYDVDAVELHNGSALFSVYYDHLPTPTTGDALWITGDGPGYLSHQSIRIALNYVGDDVNSPDIDAVMVWDRDLDQSFGEGDKIIFSVHPMALGNTVTVQGSTFTPDGGELFVWNGNVGTAVTHLVHGGYTWDTANNVAAIFGGASEDIDALDAVPEPGTLTLLAIGGLTLLGLGARRRKR